MEELPRTEEVVYKRAGPIELKATIFHPAEGEGNSTGIVFFGGGGWRHQNPMQFRPQSMELSRLGFLAVTAEYRTSDQHSTTPVESIKDAKSAVRWIRSQSEHLGVDPGRIVASGGSAGGHIAACAATIPGFEEDDQKEISSVPNALVLFNPALDLSESPGAERRMERPGFKRLGVGLEEISPMKYVVPGLPPTLIFHGSEDELVPFSQVLRFQKLMRDAGNDCVVVKADGEGHGFFNYNRSNNWYSLSLSRTRDFLSSCL
jgi:acetyl esterase/lipase